MKTILLTVVSSGLLLSAPLWAEGGGRPVEEGTVYVPIGKRDPFKRPTTSDSSGREVDALNPLEKFTLDQFQLRAILRGSSRTQAMFEDPEKNVHIVGEGTIIGRERGTISRILNREVIVTERTVNYLGVSSLFERVISLPPDEASRSTTSPARPAQGGNPGGRSGGGGNGTQAPGSGSSVTQTVTNRVVRTLSDERQGGGAAPAVPSGAAGNRGSAVGAPPQSSQQQTIRNTGTGLSY